MAKCVIAEGRRSSGGTVACLRSRTCCYRGRGLTKQFAVLCKDVEEMRETAVKELGLEMKTLKDKAKLSMLLVAFANASPTPDYQGMREAYEKKLWEIEDRKVPSRACVAKKLESVEKNDLKVEPLTEVTNTREDEGNDSFDSRRPLRTSGTG